METIQVIKIDVQTQKVYAVQTPKDLDAYYALIGCECIDFSREVTLKNEDIIVDDEGLLQQPQPPIFSINGRILTGNALVVGINEEGDTISALSTEEQIEAQVSFLGDIARIATIEFIPNDNFPDLFNDLVA